MLFVAFMPELIPKFSFPGTIIFLGAVFKLSWLKFVAFKFIFSLSFLIGTSLVVFISLTLTSLKILLLILILLFAPELILLLSLTIDSLSSFLIFCSKLFTWGTLIIFFIDFFGTISTIFGSKLLLVSDSSFMFHIFIQESEPELANLPSDNSVTLYIFPLWAWKESIFLPEFISHMFIIPLLPPVSTFPFFNWSKQ